MKARKGIALALCAGLIALAALVFGACGGETAANAELLENSEELVVIEATATGGSLEDAMKALADAGKLSYEGSVNAYGLFLTSVNGHAADAAANEYWAVYTTLGTYEGTVYSVADYGVYPYGGRSAASASYGVSGLPLVEGELYVLVFASY